MPLGLPLSVHTGLIHLRLVQMAKTIAAATDVWNQRLRELDAQFRESMVTQFQQLQARLRALLLHMLSSSMHCSINRRAILHGRVVGYASELNSYRVIFLLNGKDYSLSTRH